jgi:hypothetical protein
MYWLGHLQTDVKMVCCLVPYVVPLQPADVFLLMYSCAHTCSEHMLLVAAAQNGRNVLVSASAMSPLGVVAKVADLGEC